MTIDYPLLWRSRQDRTCAVKPHCISMLKHLENFPGNGIRNKQVSDIESGYPDIESGYRIFINCSNLRKVIHTKLDFHWAQIAFNFLEENYAICSHPPSQIYVVWMKLPCRGKYFFRNLWSSRIALRFTVSEWTQSRDWLSSSPGSCGLGKGEGASGTIRMFAAALIPTLEHGFSVAWFQIETKFYFGNHWMENRDFHVTIVQWKQLKSQPSLMLVAVSWT